MPTLLQQINHAQWGDILAIVSFFVTFSVFVVGVWKALRMKPEKREHMAHLPLETDRQDSKL